ncbi:MAG: hypothetical protein RR235_08445, partial [Oscillospiraceae bacterium]
ICGSCIIASGKYSCKLMPSIMLAGGRRLAAKEGDSLETKGYFGLTKKPTVCTLNQYYTTNQCIAGACERGGANESLFG